MEDDSSVNDTCDGDFALVQSTPADVNGDGHIDATDIQGVVNAVLGYQGRDRVYWVPHPLLWSLLKDDAA